MSQVFKNAARTELDTGISALSTQFTVIDGTIFPEANASETGGAINQASGDWFKLVLQDDDGNFEIVYCYGHGYMTHTFTVLRGQEGTTARAFLEGTAVGLRLLSSDLDNIHSTLTLLAETKQEKSAPAAKADALTNARTITLSGAVQANATWDASGALVLVTNNIDVSKANGGTLVVGRGGTGTTTSTGSGSVVLNASPALSGTPTAPTAAAGTNTTQLATTAFVKTATETRVASSEKGAANGVATLDATGKVPPTQLPSYVDDVLEFANLASFPATGESGKIYVALDTNKTYRWSGSAYVYITSGAVDSVAGKAGVVTLAKDDVGLPNVDNTTDAEKPVSTAQQTALNLKANLASPALTGTPTAPTAANGTSTTQLATTAFVQGAVGGFLSKTTTGGTTTLTTAEASNPIIKVSGALTSSAILEIPVAAKRNYSIENATTGAFTLTVKHVGLTPSVLVAQGKRNIVMTNGVGAYDAINGFESIALTGTPTAPTAGSTTNTTQIATTAFVQVALDTKVDKVANQRLMTAAEATKLANIAEQATKNASDAALRDRSTHTGTQPISTVEGLADTLATKLNYDQGAAFVSFNIAEQPSQGGLRVFQADGRTDIMPDNSWWSLIRVQHPGYPNGYWQDLALPFAEGGRPRVRQNVAGTKSQWKELAYYSDVASNTAFTSVPSTFQAWEIVVTHPHIRKMVWSSASNKYVRAPWHAPGELSYFLREVPYGHVEVRSDVVLNTADFPDLAEYLGVSAATFVLDEARGEFLRTLDSGRGIDSGRAVGSWQDSDNKSHTHTGSAASAGAHTHTVSGTAASAGAHTHSFGWGLSNSGSSTSALQLGSASSPQVPSVGSAGAHTHSVSGTAALAGDHTHTVTVNASGGTESRPRNRAYRLAVQY